MLRRPYKISWTMLMGRENEMMYELVYDYFYSEEIDGEYFSDDLHGLHQDFTGTHIELMDHIKQMRQNGCYNIEAFAKYPDQDYDC